MKEKLNTEKLLASISKKDQQQIQEVFALLEELRGLGINPSRPAPIIPYGETPRKKKRDPLFSN
jgi:hypothetical protein